MVENNTSNGVTALGNMLRIREAYCYGPDINSSTTTRKRHEQTSGRSAGDAGTSQTIG